MIIVIFARFTQKLSLDEIFVLYNLFSKHTDFNSQRNTVRMLHEHSIDCFIRDCPYLMFSNHTDFNSQYALVEIFVLYNLFYIETLETVRI